MAMAGTAKKWGDAGKGMQLESMANQQKRSDEETAFSEQQKEWYKNSRQGQETAAYMDQLQQWSKADKAYKDMVEQGQDPKALGLPPPKPERSEERSGGRERVSTCRSRWGP